MKKFISIVISIAILITNTKYAYAINYATAEEPFFVVHEYYDDYCIIEGSIYKGNENTIVILWIGEDDYPIYVCAQNNDISSIKGLNNNINLRYVNMKNNRITDISPLEQCKKLMHLDLSQNDISSISSLYGKKNLAYLDMSDNNISDISNLPDNMYHTLDLSANYITDEQIGEFSAIHKNHLPIKES